MNKRIASEKLKAKKLYWGCSVSSCPARVHTDLEYNIAQRTAFTADAALTSLDVEEIEDVLLSHTTAMILTFAKKA